VSWFNFSAVNYWWYALLITSLAVSSKDLFIPHIGWIYPLIGLYIPESEHHQACRFRRLRTQKMGTPLTKKSVYKTRGVDTGDWGWLRFCQTLPRFLSDSASFNAVMRWSRLEIDSNLPHSHTGSGISSVVNLAIKHPKSKFSPPLYSYRRRSKYKKKQLGSGS